MVSFLHTWSPLRRLCGSGLCAAALVSASVRGQTSAPASVNPGVAQVAPKRLATDTPEQTVLGNTFIGPAGWTLTVRGAATILEAPEGDSWIALVDTPAKDA